MTRASTKTKLSEPERLQALGWLLTDSVLDLCAPIAVFNDYLKIYEKATGSTDLSPKMFEAVVRMCRSSIVLAICKLEDALNNHGEAYRNAPEEIRSRVNRFHKHFKNKDYRTLRSKFIAHNYDSYKTHTYQDGDKIARGIYGIDVADLKSYFDWVKPPKNCVEARDESPVWIAHDLKEYVRSRVDLTPRVPLD